MDVDEVDSESENESEAAVRCTALLPPISEEKQPKVVIYVAEYDDIGT
jgi:hypothetical protein